MAKTVYPFVGWPWLAASRGFKSSAGILPAVGRASLPSTVGETPTGQRRYFCD